MNNHKNLYIIIAVLVLTNVATISYLIGANSLGDNWGFGMMGGNHMFSDDEHWKEHDEINSWEDMVKHMEEEHGVEDDSVTHKKVDYNKPVAETHEDTYDFGKIKQSDGVVSTTFEIENHGKEDLILGDITSSCGCTSGKVDKSVLGFDEHTDLTVYFDTNFHEEPEGVFERSVFVPTNDPDLPELQFDISVEIIKE